MKPLARALRRLPICLLPIYLLSACALVGCAALPSGAERAAQAEKLAAAHGWESLTLATPEFSVVARLPQPAAKPATDELTVYIEGDGMAWIASDRPADDPTPLNPLALKLALAQPAGQAAYLARPCQYATDARCTRRYWTSHRFAPEIVDAMNEALDQIKQRFGARRLTLVGYSGGATVAALLAARRRDVARLVSVAGNLDHRAWTQFHRVTPLTGSLDAADVRSALRDIPQWHFAGERDKTVPPPLVESFARGLPAAHVRIVAGYDHQCCWAENWPQLWEEIH